MGVPPKPDFWVHEGTPQKPHVHIAFRADNRALVDAFYQAALAAGGKDNGPPGPRPHYHKDYYGAFVLDPDGHNIEACCHSAARHVIGQVARATTTVSPSARQGRRS